MKNSSSGKKKKAANTRWIVWELGNPVEEDNELFEGEEVDDTYFPFEEEESMGMPFNMIPINLSNNSPNSVQFSRRNMWVGHTNFIIDKIYYDIIKNTEGVDIYRQMSPHTFVIAAGKLFDDATVKLLIQKRLSAVKPPNEIIQKIENNF